MCSGKVCSAIKSCQLPIQPWSVHGALSIKMANYCFLWVSLSQEAQLSFQSTGFLSCLLCLHPSPLPRLPCPLSLWKLPWVHNIVGKEGKKRERGRREGPSEHPRAPEGKESGSLVQQDKAISSCRMMKRLGLAILIPMFCQPQRELSARTGLRLLNRNN